MWHHWSTGSTEIIANNTLYLLNCLNEKSPEYLFYYFRYQIYDKHNTVDIALKWWEKLGYRASNIPIGRNVSSSGQWCSFMLKIKKIAVITLWCLSRLMHTLVMFWWENQSNHHMHHMRRTVKRMHLVKCQNDAFVYHLHFNNAPAWVRTQLQMEDVCVGVRLLEVLLHYLVILLACLGLNIVLFGQC